MRFQKAVCKFSDKMTERRYWQEAKISLLRLDLHLCMKNSSIWWFTERSIQTLKLDDPIDRPRHLHIFYRNVAHRLMKSTDNECAQPSIKAQNSSHLFYLLEISEF